MFIAMNTPSVIHSWKAMDLLFLMVKRKNIFSSSEASDFWGRLRTDFCTHPDTVSYPELVFIGTVLAMVEE